MTTTQSKQGNELKSSLLKGIQKLNRAVSSTLGPGGRTVLIKESTGEVKATKDGVSVAKAFNKLEDDIEDLGAQLLKQVSIKSANEAGDGTTTSTLLATEMIEAGMESILTGNNAVEVKNELDKLVEMVVSHIKEKSTDVASEDQINQVATISGNNDTEIGELISSAIEKVGREGVVTIEESKTGETSLEIVEGMQFDRGYKSPYFATNTSTMQAVLEDPYVMLYDGRISTAQEIVNVLHKANSENKPLLIIAEDFGDEALATLIVNRMRGIVQVCAVKAPDFGERKTLILEDIAVLTGGQVISKDKGHKLEKILHQQYAELLGKCRLATVSKEETTIVDGKGDQEKIQTRALEIKEQIEKSTSFYEKEKLQERLGKLVGGVAIISVGGNSDIEIKEKKDRVEDALFATKAALADGIVPGGGVALLQSSDIVQTETGDSRSTYIAKGILKTALLAPFKTILLNAGIENWWDKIPEDGFVYDAKNHKIVNGIESGIIDPTKVVITALRNAASVAGTILTTEAAIFEKADKKGDQEQQIPGMGGMY
ncbi:MAG: chaperonin GroEL [Proteobacteria bacterium]|nr:chaperonin GroEL [Pseudomonadota bacterium]